MIIADYSSPKDYFNVAGSCILNDILFSIYDKN